jgi:hypothetical protein
MDTMFDTPNARQLEIEALCDGKFPASGTPRWPSWSRTPRQLSTWC